MKQQIPLQSNKSKTEPKSSLNPIGVQKINNIEYRKEAEVDDQAIQLSDQQKQQEINKMRQEYIQQKLNRKKQMSKIKRQQFGSSSSQDDDIGVQQSLSGNSEQIGHKIEQKARQQSYYSTNQAQQGSFLSKPQKIFHLKGKQIWSQQYLILKQHSLFLNERELEILKIHKIKSIPQVVSQHLYKIKLSYDSDDIMLAASNEIVQIKKDKLPLHYGVLASIIIRKLEMMGLKFYPMQKNVPGVPESIVKNSMIYGKIFKKSQILGRWQERLIVINQVGMYSYKRFNQQHSMFIAANSVKEIWTRFEIVDENLLVLKILHSSNTKTEFGIPITDFLNEKNWLYQFYKMGQF